MALFDIWFEELVYCNKLDIKFAIPTNSCDLFLRSSREAERYDISLRLVGAIHSGLKIVDHVAPNSFRLFYLYRVLNHERVAVDAHVARFSRCMGSPKFLYYPILKLKRFEIVEIV